MEGSKYSKPTSMGQEGSTPNLLVEDLHKLLSKATLDQLVQIIEYENKERALGQPSSDLTARFNVLKKSYPKM